MTSTSALDPHALPPAAARAIAPRTAGGPGATPPASRPTAFRGTRPTATPTPATAMSLRTAGTTAAPSGARELLRRLVPHAEALATLGITEQQYESWAADGRAWPTWTRPDGERLADAADVLAVLELAGGAA